MELAISSVPLFEQVMVVGDNRPYLSALVVLTSEAAEKPINHDVLLEFVCERIKMFPGYAQIRRVLTISEPWTVENDMLTPTLKLKRDNILKAYAKEIDELYQRRHT